MIQHINLLTQRSRRQGYERLAFWAVFLAFVGLLALAGNNELRLQRMAEVDAHMQQSVSDLKLMLEKRRRGDGATASQALGEQITALRSQIDARRDWSDLIQKGELGTSVAYSRMLGILAALHQDGVWLQGLDVSKGGQSVSINGQSVSSVAVMRYIEQVNEAFKPMNIQFSAIEITEEAATGESAPKTGILKFKLY